MFVKKYSFNVQKMLERMDELNITKDDLIKEGLTSERSFRRWKNSGNGFTHTDNYGALCRFLKIDEDYLRIDYDGNNKSGSIIYELLSTTFRSHPIIATCLLLSIISAIGCFAIGYPISLSYSKDECVKIQKYIDSIFVVINIFIILIGLAAFYFISIKKQVGGWVEETRIELKMLFGKRVDISRIKEEKDEKTNK